MPSFANTEDITVRSGLQAANLRVLSPTFAADMTEFTFWEESTIAFVVSEAQFLVTCKLFCGFLLSTKDRRLLSFSRVL
jgi:hypothetical protein